MGTISTDTKLGIITLVDDEYNYVWSVGMGGLELRFKHNPEVQFECGEMIRFIQSHPTKSIQIVHNLMKCKDKLPIEKDKTVRWKLKVHLTFAPQEILKDFQKKDDFKRLKAVAHTESFNLVASYVENVNYKLGVVYEAHITRVPNGHGSMAENIGIVFMVLGGNLKKFVEVTDPAAIAKVMEGCPWKDLVMPQDQENVQESGLTEVLSSPNIVPPVQQYDNGSESDSSTFEIDYHQNHTLNQERTTNEAQSSSKKMPNDERCWKTRDEPLTDYYAQHLHDQMEGDEHIGLIVGSEKEYSVIWSPRFGLVRLQLERIQNPVEPIWAVASWVKFRCFEERSQLLEQRTCEYTAYDVRKTAQPQDVEVRTFGRSEHEFGRGLVARMKIKNRKTYSSVFFFSEDKFFGRVLCPVKDRNFLDRLDEKNAIEVMAVFSYEYQHSKWIVFSMLSEETWTKLEGLTPRIDDEVQPFFTIRTPDENNYQEEEHNMFTATNQFKPPTDWQGVVEKENKLIDVLGVVVCHEGDTTVIATSFGLARQPIKWEMGTWVCATMKPDEDDSPFTYPNILRGHGSYIIEQSRKIPPPLSTRVFHDDTKKVDMMLICCSVTMVDGILQNDYLGIVDDPLDRLKSNQMGRNGRPISAFLVEISLSRSNQGRFWKVLKSHGEYTNTVKTVALKLSYWPHSMGRTCDEAHNILCDSEFDLQKYLQQKKSTTKGMASNSALPTQQQLSQKPSSSKESTKHFKVEQPNEINPQRSYGDAAHQSSSSNSIPTNEMGNSQMQPTSGIRGDNQADLHSQLHLYEPESKGNKRALGIVVTKKEQFAILYNREFGDCIVLARSCFDQMEFDNLFQLGNVIGVRFAPVMQQVKRGLTYSYMCVPEFKASRNVIKSRAVLNRFAQIHIRCEFRKTNIKECTDDLDSGEREKKYYIDTDVGKVLLNQDVLDKNDLFGKVVKLWITHIQKKYGCHWQITLGDIKTLEEHGLNPDDPKLSEIELLTERAHGHPASFSGYYYPKEVPIQSQRQSSSTSFPADVEHCPLVYISDDASSGFSVPNAVRNNIPRDVKRLATNGYADFAFGSHVPDVMNGDRYPVERYIPSMAEYNDDSDPEEAEEREINEMFRSSSSEEGDKNSNESVESYHTDHNFADDDDEFGNYPQRIRIIGNSTPPPTRGQISHPGGQSMQGAVGQSQQQAENEVAVDTLITF